MKMSDLLFAEEGQTHLDIYENHSVLHDGENTFIYIEGKQSGEAKARYELIQGELNNGFLNTLLERVRREGFNGDLNESDKELLLRFAGGVTSNFGRALVAVGIQQLTIKTICPEQSIRLHKASNQRNAFSWQEGISMRNIDASYITPFLREKGLLKLNSDGAFMTRTLAENYPFTKLYKAKVQGPKEQWVEIVDRLEDGSLPALDALEFILAYLQNKSDEFAAKCNMALETLHSSSMITLEKAERSVKSFLRDTEYPARAFEISLHSFMQALIDLNYAEDKLEQLSQMRSANKKHGNVGDIELKEGGDILESWDAKYKKPYLIDELSELEDKLETAPRVATAGFVTDSQPDLASDVVNKMQDIENEFDTEVKILSLHEWLDYQIDLNYVSDKDALGAAWIRALVESLTLNRIDIAPIDEPCEKWVEDITKVMKRTFK